MSLRLSDFVEGVVLEVLWDVERIIVEGRRQSERVMESVWWKGEAIEVRIEGEKTFAKIQYDAMGDFQSQIGEVRVFPHLFQMIDGPNKTQLRWRYHESTGEVSYDTSNLDRVQYCDIPGSVGESGDVDKNARLVALHNKLDDFSFRLESVERLVMSRQEVSFRVMETEQTSKQCCERIFALLRQKIAGLVQKPLLPYRRNGGPEVSETPFDLSCAGSIKASVDCTIEEFEMVCRSVQQIGTRVYFRADGHPFTPSTGTLHASVGVGLILFDTLSVLCHSIGIRHEEDILKVSRQESHAGKKPGSEDAAVRVAGSFFADNESGASPSAILVCGCIHDGMSSGQNLDVLTRINRELDPRTMWYRHPLRAETMKVSGLLQRVYPNLHGSTCEGASKEANNARNADSGCFALRWKPIPTGNGKIWSRNMIMRPDYAGSLEVEIPYVIIRGTAGIKEFKEVATDRYIRALLK